MHRFIVLTAIAGLVGGLIGVWAVGQLSGQAGAAPPPPQAREDQIYFGATGATQAGPSYSFFGSNTPAPFLAIDSAEYPASTVFSLEVMLERGNDSTNCLRLFDMTVNAPVAGSDICITGGAVVIPPTRLRSSSFVLPSGLHEYAIQGKFEGPQGTCCGVDVRISRIIAEWTERR